MKLMTLRNGEEDRVAVLLESSCVPMEAINDVLDSDCPADLIRLIESGRIRDLDRRLASLSHIDRARLDSCAQPIQTTRSAPLLRHPHKLWGIGLNYRDHAADLDETAPTAEPASFMKPDTAIVGPGETIWIPRLSERTTGEAELGIVIGRRCRDVPRGDWLSVVAGFTCILDMTAEDILRRNPRNLTQSKSFDTFISIGPALLTPDEFEDIFALRVRTVINDRVHAENIVSNMTFPPDFLVSYHSQIMTLLPGDIISTGTPGAVPLSDGDTLECHIDGFPLLINPVRDLKVN
jgi:2-keto-4-pentenoate hydratase/2-oxohepta-3-ene-1,7-dioic acid hydratase in catechol pathway